MPIRSTKKPTPSRRTIPALLQLNFARYLFKISTALAGFSKILGAQDKSKGRARAKSSAVVKDMNAAQARMARAALEMNVRELAAAAVVPANVIARIESGVPVEAPSLAAIRQTFEAAGIEFLEDDGHGPGVRLRKSRKPAAAARSAGVADATEARLAARGKAEKAVDRALAGSRAPPEDKAHRKRKLTRVAKELKSK